MEKINLVELKRLYMEKIIEKRELLRLVESEDVKKYKSILKLRDESPYLFLLDEEIMHRLLLKYDVEPDTNVTLNMGYYLIPEKRLDFKRRLIKESDKYIIEREKKRNIVVSPIMQYSDYSHVLFDLESGKEVIGDKANVMITLPTFKKFVDNMPDYDKRPPFYNPDFFKGENYIQGILRAQFYLRLMKEDYDKVIDFYSNEENYPIIDEEVFDFMTTEKLLFENKDSELQLRKNLCYTREM